MLMFTGFLGAGKTTLLRELLSLLAKKNVVSDVILNDRENAYIDKATLEDHTAEIQALTGSCVCCEGFNDLVNVIMKASATQHDVLLLELNGTADPIPLQESFTLLESRFFLSPRWQVCVIDARSFRKRGKFNDLESLQLETASHYYISHDSELTAAEELKIEQGIKEINPRATRTSTSELVDAIDLAISKNTGRAFSFAQKKPGEVVNSPFHSGLRLQKLGTKSDHHDRHKLAHEFTGCQIMIPEPVSQDCVVNWLDQLPESVIRAKALLILEGDLQKFHLFERVGLCTSPHPIQAQRRTDKPCSGIFIGPDLDPEAILKVTKEHLHPECHFPELKTHQI